MKSLDWQEEYNTGITIIDFQHRKFLEIINSLINVIGKFKEEGQTDRKELSKSLDMLSDYISIHFTTEEQIMEAYGYPDLKNHKLIHEDFKKRYIEYREFLKSKHSDIPDSVLKYMQSWLVEHICKTDKDQLTPFLKSKGLN